MAEKDAVNPDDDRFKLIFEFIEEFTRGNINQNLQHSGKRDELDGVIVGLNMILEEVRSKYISEEYVKKRLKEVRQVLISYSREKFNISVEITGDNKILDDLAEEVNRLGEKLKYYKISNNELINELQIKNNDLKQFSYIVSHNLRSPIANIIALSRIFNSQGINDEKRLQIIDNIQSSAQKLDGLVKDLNEIIASRTASTQQKSAILLPDLIKSVRETLKKEIKSSDTVINTSIEEDAKEIFSLRSYLESIFYNLISNAIKYRSPERVPIINISAKKAGNEIKIAVSDNGMGINLDKNKKLLFGLYQRFNVDVAGKGLGLHMTKNQVEALGGKISVESEVGKGTKFSINLPAE